MLSGPSRICQISDEFARADCQKSPGAAIGGCVKVVKDWMAAANKTEQQQLADLAGTSRAHLYHLSAGRRTCGPDLARALELASTQLAEASRGRLPVLKRTDLCPACGRCEYAAKCSGAA